MAVTWKYTTLLLIQKCKNKKEHKLFYNTKMECFLKLPKQKEVKNHLDFV